MEDQIIMIFLSIMDQAMSILQVEEAAASSSSQRLMRRRRYVNRDHEAAHFRLRHNYFDDDCVYSVILLPKVSYVEDYFPNHYAEA
jgi:hypothetical protein